MNHHSLLCWLGVITGALMTTDSDAAQIILGYCNGQIADHSHGNITGLSGSNTRISAAIHLTADVLDEYRNGSITTLRYGFPGGVTLPSAITLWIRSEQGGANIAEANIVPHEGWNEYTLPTAYGLATADDLWVGMTYLQNKKINVLSLVGESVPEGCYLAKGNNWTNQYDQQMGNLSIEAIAEGDDFVTHDISLSSVTTPSAYCYKGDSLIVTGTVANHATCEAAVKLCWTLGTEAQGEELVAQPLRYRSSQTFRLAIATDRIAEGEHQLCLDAVWADGSDDQKPADNTWQTRVEISSQAAVRRMVCEEGTGMWCGWCVRGIVGLNYMTERYPDTFIGISVHSRDDYQHTAYASWIGQVIQSGLPGSIINRMSPCDPSREDLEQAYLARYKYSPYNISVSAQFPDQSLSEAMQATMEVTTEVTPLANITEHDLRIAIVVTEDSLYGYQNNDYAGTGREMGGFEEMDGQVYYPLPHVARAIVPSIEGDTEALPQQMTKGQAYAYTRSVALPQIRYQGRSVRFVDTHQLCAIALLLDGRNGEILNAAKITNHATPDDAAIKTVSADMASTDGGQRFTLDGRPCRAGSRGFMISKNGKIMVLE